MKTNYTLYVNHTLQTNKRCEKFYYKYAFSLPGFYEMCNRAADPTLGHVERYDIVYNFLKKEMPRISLEFGTDFTITDFVYWLEDEYGNY